MAAMKLPGALGAKLGSSKDEPRSRLSRELEGEAPELDDEDEDDSLEAEAAGAVRAALKGGDDGALATALKEFMELCGSSKHGR